MVSVPAPRVVQHVTLLEPTRAQDAGDAAVGKPLRPGQLVIAGAGEGQRRLALERDPGPRLVERRAKAGASLLHRVQEHAVDAEVGDEPRDGLLVVDGLAPRADIPRVVVDEDAHAASPEDRHELTDAGHVPVEVELVAIVDPDHRIRLPEDDPVEAAEVSRGLVEESLGRESARRMVVEQLVPEPGERDREAALRPGELGPAVLAVVVRDSRGGLRPPASQSVAPRGPIGGIVGSGKDLRGVELVQAGARLERDACRQVDRPGRPWVAWLLDGQGGHQTFACEPATARVRSTSSSSVIPS